MGHDGRQMGGISSADEARAMVKDAVRCCFDETMETPKIIRLHFVRDEVLV
jgi:hypothetical protein